MIEYSSFQLANGLTVYVHEDPTTPMAVLNILYNVGSKDESEHKTGFAHLFEHLMFGGSVHVPSYDVPLQKVGGENNAFTSPDITNYYCTLPANNLETAFWLESDRMLSLSFDPKVLEVQQKVVIEEFKQRYLNQPYGDVWLKLNPLAYEVHPYRWNTIGKEIAHIEEATMLDVKDFFYKFYIPNNAVMVVAGGVKTAEVEQLARKWFEPIPGGKPYVRQLPTEPKQNQPKKLETEAAVPLDAFYKAWHMGPRKGEHYYATDLLSDILGRGNSSRLYQKLVKEKRVFNSITSHISGSVDPGLFIVQGKLNKGISLEEGEQHVDEIIQNMLQDGVQSQELDKVKNQAESSLRFGEMELLNRAMNLAYAAHLGDPDLCNQEATAVARVTLPEVEMVAKTVLVPSNSSTLYYRAV